MSGFTVFLSTCMQQKSIFLTPVSCLYVCIIYFLYVREAAGGRCRERGEQCGVDLGQRTYDLVLGVQADIL